MIYHAQNTLINGLNTAVSVQNNKSQVNPFFGQGMPDKFERSDITTHEENLDKSFSLLKSIVSFGKKVQIKKQLSPEERENLISQLHYKYCFLKTEILKSYSDEKLLILPVFMSNYFFPGRSYLRDDDETFDKIIALPDRKFKQANELAYIKERSYSEQLYCRDLYSLACLPPDEFKRAKELLYIPERGKYQITDVKWIYYIVKIPPDEFKRVKELLYIPERGEYQLDAAGSYQIVRTLSPEEFKHAKELLYIKERGEKQLNGKDIFHISQLPPEQFKQAKEILYIKERGENQLDGSDIYEIAKLPSEQFKQAKEILYIKERGEDKLTGKVIHEIAKLPSEQFKQAKEILYIKERGKDQLNEKVILRIIALLNSGIEMTEINNAIKKIDVQKEKIMQNPELYINDDIESSTYENVVSVFFKDNMCRLLKLATIYDNDCINNILRMRFDDTKDVLNNLNELKSEFFILLKKLVNSKDINGKPFSSEQKIDFIDICIAYQELKIPTEKTENMLKANRVDIDELKMDLFKFIMREVGISEEEIANIPKEKLLSWDKKYLHKLCYIDGEEGTKALTDLIRVANSESSFKEYIQNTDNEYGKVNETTKKEFAELGLNYDSWVSPISEPVKFVSKDKNTEQLFQIITQLEEDMNTLRENPAAKAFVDKRFSKYLKEDKFFVSNINNKKVLENLIKELIKQLSELKTRAEHNVSTPEKSATAQRTLTIFSHLEQRLKDVQNVSDVRMTKSIDWTIKMWDRIPQKDLFQGNYSTCCIGIGNGNGHAMPPYLLNTAFNMIEIIDTKTGKIKGNALCYFVKDKKNQPIFIIDNIEIANSSKLSDEKSIDLRKAIIEYASRVANEVAHTWKKKIFSFFTQKKIPVYMSDNYNDVPVEDLKSEEREISLIGEVDCDEIYMDLFDGWADKNDYMNTTRKLLKLK